MSLNIGPKGLRAGVDYTFINQIPSEGIEFNDREELHVNLTSAIARYWNIYLTSRYNLGDDGGLIANIFGASYEDECIVLRGSAGRDYTRDRDVKKGVAVMLQIVFKTLGEPHT